MSNESKNTLRAIEEGIERYNRTHSPEANAKLIKFMENKKEFEVEFTGSFCETCGIRDWLEDLKYILEDLGLNTELIEMKEIAYGRYIGKYKVLKST